MQLPFQEQPAGLRQQFQDPKVLPVHGVSLGL